MSTLSNTRDHLSLQTNKQGIDIFRRYYDNVLAAIFLIVVLMLFYRDVVFGGRTFLILSSAAYDYPSERDQKRTSRIEPIQEHCDRTKIKKGFA